MTIEPKIADLLRRLASQVIVDIEPEPGGDPVRMLVREYIRIWRLANACLDDDFGAVGDEVNEIAGELERRIVDTVATTKIGLILQARLLAHESFSNNLFPDLIEVVVQGIIALVPEPPHRLHGL